MDSELSRFWSDLIGRLTGPMTFRLILQPSMAILYAFRDGLKDAREGRPAYFWSLFLPRPPGQHPLKEGLKATSRVIVLGMVMDLIYQLIVFRTVHVLEMIVVALLLAFVPYLLTRGPVNRFARAWHSHKVPTR